MDCVFCKIIEGEIPSYTVYEDENFKAFLDISPATLGHVLVVPKVHYADLFELPDETAILPVLKKVATAIKEVFGCGGVNILQNNGEPAGQTVFHCHFHIIPRYKDDILKMGWKHLSPSKDEMQKVCEDLKSRL